MGYGSVGVSEFVFSQSVFHVPTPSLAGSFENWLSSRYLHRFVGSSQQQKSSVQGVWPQWGCLPFEIQINNDIENTLYGGYLGIAQKVIEGVMSHDSWHMHVILRWLKIRKIS